MSDKSTITTADLLPCPFCGGPAELDDLGDPQDDSMVSCCNQRRCGIQQIARFSPETAVVAWNTRVGHSAEDAVADGLAEQVAEAMEDNRGFWRSCTGCHETNEGYPTGAYPYSRALKCELGSGCRECGGLGATWDNTDYADLADFMRAADRDHENVKRILIEHGIQAYPADQIAMAIIALEVPAALSGAPSAEEAA